MERIVVTVSSDLFDDSQQEASLRKNISVRTLLSEIQREFELPEANYTIRLKGNNRTLELDKTIEQLGILAGAELMVIRERRSSARAPQARSSSGPQSISAAVQGYFEADSTGQVFEIRWQPALIGRPDSNKPETAHQLAVNLSGFEEARSVSRPHARVTERNNIYFIESLAPHNLVRLNDEELHIEEKRSLKSGDKIMIGKIPLTFKTHSAPITGDAPTTKV